MSAARIDQQRCEAGQERRRSSADLQAAESRARERGEANDAGHTQDHRTGADDEREQSQHSARSRSPRSDREQQQNELCGIKYICIDIDRSYQFDAMTLHIERDKAS